MWVFANNDGPSIDRIDTNRLEVLETFAIPGISVGQMAVDSGRLFMLDRETRQFHVLDLNTPHSVSEAIPGVLGDGLATGGGRVWIVDGVEATLTGIDQETTRTETTIRVGMMPGRVAYTPDALWVADFSDTVVYRVDPVEGTAEPVPVGGVPLGIAEDNGSVWALVVTLDNKPAVTQISSAPPE